MSWNPVDYLIISLIVVSGISGFRQGLIKAIGSLVGVIAGILLAFVYYDHCALYLEEYYGVSSAIAVWIRGRVPITVLSMERQLVGIEFSDTAQYLAYLILLAVSFILIYLLSSRILMFLWNGLDHLFSWGVLATANKTLGMILVILKTTVILVVISGLMYPALEMAAKMGFTFGLIAFQWLKHSLLASYLLGCFDLLKYIVQLKL